MSAAVQRFRKKPVVVEAMRWDGSFESQRAIINWSGGAASGWFINEGYCLDVRTLEGTMRADVGDWIIRGTEGEFYPCKPAAFDSTFEETR